jgi:hypothetical protein
MTPQPMRSAVVLVASVDLSSSLPLSRGESGLVSSTTEGRWIGHVPVQYVTAYGLARRLRSTCIKRRHMRACHSSSGPGWDSASTELKLLISFVTLQRTSCVGLCCVTRAGVHDP